MHKLHLNGISNRVLSYTQSYPDFNLGQDSEYFNTTNPLTQNKLVMLHIRLQELKYFEG